MVESVRGSRCEMERDRDADDHGGGGGSRCSRCSRCESCDGHVFKQAWIGDWKGHGTGVSERAVVRHGAWQ